jgi:hypothetical protein
VIADVMNQNEWIDTARKLFERPKPSSFCDPSHCDECFEHNETLSSNTPDSIGMRHLGNPGGDPICFSNVPGKMYYFPAMIRLSLETAEDDFYFSQLLFHLEWNGKDNEWVSYCSKEQREFLSSFIEYMIDNYSDQLENHVCSHEAIKAYEIWKP